MKFKSDIEVQAGLRDGSDDIGTAGQILSSTGSQTNWIDQSSINVSAKLVVIACKNTSGATITKGTPVYQTGTVGATDVIEIAEADASDEDKMAAIGLLQTDINNNDFGNVVITGELLNFTTDPIDGVTPVTGDTIYVKSGGGLTLTKPTGLEFIQNVGLVGKVSGGNAGSLTVSSIMRSNDVPTPLYIDHDNQRLGIGATSPGTELEIGDGTGSPGLTLNKATTGTASLFFDNGGNNKNWIKADAAESLIFGTNNSTNVTIKEGGNVGIGMTDPAANLHVESTNDGMTNGINTNQLKLSYGASVNGAGSSIAFGVSAVSNFTGAKIVHERKGSNSVGDLSFWTRSTGGINTDYDLTVERMRISSSGNVGIGTTSPDYLLDLYKSTDTTSSSTGTTLQRLWNYVGSDLNQQKTFVDFVFQDDNNNEYPQVRIGAEVGQNGNSDTQQKEGSGAFVVYTNNATGDGPGTPTGLAERFRVDYSGNVGIGTTDPGSLLHVEGSRTTAVFQANQTGTGVIANFKQAGNSKVLIDNAGNVGINTTSPDFKLDVDGTFGVSDLPFNTDSVSVLVADETIGAELITNGNFATDSDWSKGVGWTISGGTANAVSATSEPMAQTVSGFAAGNIYKVRFEVTAVTNGYIRVYAYVGASGTFTNIFNSTSLTTGVYEGIFEFGGTNKILRFYGSSGGAGGFAGSIDNVSVKQVTSASNQIQKRELGTGAFGPTPVGAYLPLAGGTMTGGTNHGDSVYSYWGASNDLQIYHDGTDSYVSNTQNSGDLIIQNGGNDKDVIFKCDDGSGGTTPYITLDGSAGNIKVYKNMNFQDNDVLQMGTSGDLNIYHDGSNSYIQDTGTGTLNLQGSTQVLIGGTNGEVGVQYVENAGVGLRHNNVTKLTTESTGIVVVGDIKIDSALLSNQNNTNVDTGTEAIASVVLATYTAAFFDFVIKKGTNVRSGTVYACHDGTNVEFTETSTNDLGDTSDVTLNVVISTIYLQLQATTTSDDWSVKSLIRAI